MRKGIKKQFWLSEKDAADLKQKAQRCGVTETSEIGRASCRERV